MVKILLALILTIPPAFAFNLNGKRWAEDTALIMLPSSFNTDLMRKRMEVIAGQVRRNVPFKVKLRYHDLRYNSILDVINLATEHNIIIVLHKENDDLGLGNRVANAGFITSNGGTLVHAGVIRINDLRYKEVTAGGNLNYLANITGHEVCHLLGLDHADFRIKPTPLMISGGKFSKFKRLGLAADDKKGLRKVYGLK